MLHKTAQFVSAIILAASFSLQVAALPVSHYADHSVLSQGRWVKIATTERGIHRIDAATLQSWGFSDPSKVSIYGQNGYMLPETFSTQDTDDLQAIPTHFEGDAIYFYASGSTQWNRVSGSTYWTHTNNYYSTISYYFLTEERPQLALDTSGNEVSDGTAITTFDEYILHENDNVCLGQTGRLYLGEDLTTNSEIGLKAPGITGEKMTVYIAMGANSSSTYTLATIYNGKTLTPAVSIGASDSYTYIKEAKRYYTIDAAEDFTLNFKSSGSGTLNCFYLDYIRLFYTRRIELDSAQMQFRRINIDGDYYAIDTKGRNNSDIRVWNVSNVNKPYMLKTNTIDNKIAFKVESNNNNYNEYIAFDIKDQALHTPQYVCNVEAQDIHGIDDIPDMVIVTTRYFIKEAERIAQLHRDMDNMKVLVCDQLAIFNEFSGGTPDATAIRRMMKMFYDRAQAGYGNAPRYLLLYGRGSYNNRAIAHKLHQEDNIQLVTYQSESSTDQRYSYISDDYFGLLDDKSGVDMTAEAMQVSIGRMPLRNVDESQQVYNKLVNYINQKPINNLWKNKSCFIGFRGDNNLHVRQINTIAKQTVEAEQQHIIVDKVYQNAYATQGGKAYAGTKEQIFRDLEEGAMIYNFMGHADHVSIGRDLISITDAKAMTNKMLPIFITATCDVCPFDKDENSVGEALFKNGNGGFIALYTTTRTVYTNGNENINRELMRELFVPGNDGKVRLGDVMRRAKTTLLYDKSGGTISDPNKLKYCLIGDPALAVPLPSYNIKIETINGTAVSEGAKIATPANSEVTITGSIYNTAGEAANDFNGTLCYEVYDAPTEEAATESVSSSAGTTTLSEKFYVRKYKLATAADTIVNGKFTATFQLPIQCLQSDSTALISLYAYNTDKNIEAKGYNKNILINGIEESTPDNTAPTISGIWVGDETFSEGNAVSANTHYHCNLTDEESGITNNELSMGKLMTLWLDGNLICNDLAGYYAPTAGTGTGTIDYPLSNLSVGAHSITIKVFDNAGNSAEATTTFVVEKTATEQYTIDIAEDPVTTQATISLEGVVSNDMTIRYVILESNTGNEVWTNNTSATQVVWDLTTATGTAQPGEYTCYAYISTEEGKFVTIGKKIIVIRQ